MSFLRVVSAVLVAAGTLAAQGPMRVRVVLPAYHEPIALDTVMRVTEYEATPGKLWSTAEKVFYDLKISTDTRDSVRGVIGNTNYVKSGMMTGKPMSMVLNCGLSITGPNADNFRINMVLMAMVLPGATPTTTKLGVAYVASGMDMRGSSSNPVQCATTGIVEQDFAARVKKIIATAP
jgi:hypothetical protein